MNAPRIKGSGCQQGMSKDTIFVQVVALFLHFVLPNPLLFSVNRFASFELEFLKFSN